MEFRIVSIRELPSEQFGSALELELGDVQPSNSSVDGYYKPVSRITAYVPNFGEFRNLTIGTRLNFGVANRVPDYDESFKGIPSYKPYMGIDKSEGYWKSPEVRIKVDEAYNALDKLPDAVYEPEPPFYVRPKGQPVVDGRSTRGGCTGLPPSGLASEAIEPNERAATQAVVDRVYQDNKPVFKDLTFRDVNAEESAALNAFLYRRRIMPTDQRGLVSLETGLPAGIRKGTGDPQERAREEMKKAFPIIVRLLRNKEFVESVVEKGYKPNLAGILRAYLEASDE